MMNQDPPSSPSTATRKVLTQPTVVPLDSTTRQTPIHPDLPFIKVPAASSSSDNLKPYQYHPVTCEPLTTEDLKDHKTNMSLQQLAKQYPTPEAVEKAQAEAIQEVKMRSEESDKKRKDVEREMEEQEKMREVERKVERKVYERMKEMKGRS